MSSTHDLSTRETDLQYRLEIAVSAVEAHAEMMELSGSGESGSGPGDFAKFISGVGYITEVLARELRYCSNELEALLTVADLVPRRQRSQGDKA